jgi:hypothetical protein
MCCVQVVRDDPNIEDDAESWNSFFSSGTCAGRVSDNGPVNSADGKGARWDPLCKNCGVRVHAWVQW